jgi:Bacteriophage translational regulator
MNLSINDLIEVRLSEDDDFLKIRETLTRIGIASRKEKKLYQSCHILHKQGHYFIVHFKELFALDGKPTNFSTEDVARRNTIANLLSDWDLVELIDPQKSSDPVAPITQIKILSHKEKFEWELLPKYAIGRRKEPEGI